MEQGPAVGQGTGNCGPSGNGTMGAENVSQARDRGPGTVARDPNEPMPHNKS